MCLEETLKKAAEHFHPDMMEAQVKQAVVLPILRALDWDDSDPAEFVPEFSVSEGYVDYALLCAPDGPLVFIEAKRPGGVDVKAEEQLFRYANNKGVPLLILTDGDAWDFYLSMAVGEPANRQFCRVELTREERIPEYAKFFEVYLRKSNVASGEAKRTAEEKHKNNKDKTKAHRAIPGVWRELLETPDGKLCDLLTEEVESACGTKPHADDVKQFLKGLIPDKPPPQTPTLKNSNRRSRDIQSCGAAKKPKEIIHFEPMSETEHFRVLGLPDSTNVAIQIKATHEIQVIPRDTIQQEGNLITIAPLQWWIEQAGGQGFGKKGIRLAFADSIIRAAEKKGSINVSERIRARGAAVSPKGVTYNVGDGVLVAGPDGRLSDKKLFSDMDDEYLYVPGPKIKLKEDVRAERWCKELYDAVMAYRWNEAIDGRAFMGWIVSSIVGGALDFRPMGWLIAPASTGKTFLLEKVLTTTLEHMVSAFANATEAALRAVMKSDSLPCYFDEFEPHEGEGQKWGKILNLIRLASGGTDAHIRGTASNKQAIMHRPRFSMLVASRMMPNPSTTDGSHFFTMRLSEEPVVDWPKVRDSILAATTPEKTIAIRTHVIRNTPSILASVNRILDDMSRVFGKKMDMRLSMMTAALTAGAGFMGGDYKPYVLRDENNPNDTYSVLSTLLTSLVYVPGEEGITLAEVLRVAYFTEDGTFMPTGANQMMLGIASRHGFRMDGPERMFVAGNLEPQNAIIQRTKYRHIGLQDYFKRLPGAKLIRDKDGSSMRLRFGGMRRVAYELGPEALEEAGFTPSKGRIGDDDTMPVYMQR